MSPCGALPCRRAPHTGMPFRRGAILVGGDDQMQNWLPEAPPPRPDDRRMAIDEALRRFDGEEARPRAGRRITWGAPLRAMLGRPQIAAFATIVLVAFIGLPLWLSDTGPRVQRDTELSERFSPRQAALDDEAERPAPTAAI